MKQLNRKKVLNGFIDVICWVIGSFIYAAAINMFSIPNKLSLGGFTGISTILNSLFGTPVGLTMFLLNVPFFLIAFKVFGLKFIVKTAIATALCSVAIDIKIPFLPSYTGDKLLAACFCGVLSGIGLAIIFIRDATTGGTDVIAKLVHKKFQHISIGTVILLADALVAITSGIVYKNFESVLYAAIVIFISSRTIDYIIYGTGGGKMLLIVTDYADEIIKAITEELSRGVTVLPVKGGYTGEDKNMLMCAIRSHEIAKLNRIIRSVDEKAFVIVTEAGEILGEGFTFGK